MQGFPTKIKSVLSLLFLFSLLGCSQAAGPDNTPTAPAAEADIEPATAVPLADTPAAESAAHSAAGERSIGDPYAPELGNTGYDVEHYTLQIALDPRQDYQVTATAILEALAVTDNLGQLSLDFIGFDIDTLLVDGQPADYWREEGKLITTLPRPLTAGQPFTLSISYQGESVQAPSPYVGFASWLGLFYARDDTLYILSEPDGSRYWFPNNDHPRDKATYRFEVTVPEGFTAVANGALVEVRDNTYIWEHDYPMASYLATIAVGDYTRIDETSPAGIPLRHYTFTGSQGEFARSTEVTGEAIDWMSDLFGPYPFEEYGYVAVHAPGVSLETQTMVLLSTGMLNERTVIHELAHMWFGDWVSLHSWGEMWRNEGFATYISIMWDHRDDPDGLALEMAGIRAAMEDNDDLPPLKNPPPPDLFNGYIYFGGALMVHELRQEMGDEAFFSGLQTYFQTYGGGTASDAEFMAVMEAAAGKSLDAFFADWLE